MSFDIRLTTPLYSGPVQAFSYNYTEDSSPLSGADTSGSVGTFSVTIPVPDPDLPDAQRHPLWQYHRTLGDAILHGATVDIYDSRKGVTSGTVKVIERSRDGGSVQLSGTTRMSLMNVFNVQAQPFSGTLNGAITYYLGLAGITSGFSVDAVIANRPVTIPGWYGELWLHLKQLVSANSADISLVSNIIEIRPVRERIASTGRDLTRSTNVGGYNLAQAVEVYQYNNRPITNQLVYPIGVPTTEGQVLNVNAGETSDYTLQLSSSLTSIQQPTMMTSMDLSYQGSSAYVITTSDGTPVEPLTWTGAGGEVSISIGQDTTSLVVFLKAPIGLTNGDGSLSPSFSLSLTDPDTTNRFSTLRILGSGVAFDKQKKRISTGIPASMTATDVGLTIDNPTVSTADDVSRVGLRAARQYTGIAMSLSGTVVSVNRRGDSGQSSVPTYEQVQNALASILGGTPTYQQVQNYHTSLGLLTYEQVQNYWESYFANPDIDQVFGNVQGARVYDSKTHRWYRVRSASLTDNGIAFTDAEDDLTYQDYQNFHAGKTYAQVQAALAGLNYRQVELIGMV